jgi:hypothetical protein
MQLVRGLRDKLRMTICNHRVKEAHDIPEARNSALHQIYVKARVKGLADSTEEFRD